MKQLIFPWLATFLFGCGVFVVGKIFQRAEKRRLEAKKAESERNTLLAIVQHVKETQEQQPGGIMAAIRGQESQRVGRHLN